jgi:hypothetical protein
MGDPFCVGHRVEAGMGRPGLVPAPEQVLWKSRWRHRIGEFRPELCK